jgi:very-short-patch-repair endonuclease
VKTIDGKTYKWIPKNGKVTNKRESLLHKTTRIFLRNLFPTVIILEEVRFRAKKRQKLYLDFFIPQLMLAIECQGEQHQKYIHFFHKNSYRFIRSQQNDKEKAEWCKLNNITLVYVFSYQDLAMIERLYDRKKYNQRKDETKGQNPQ